MEKEIWRNIKDYPDYQVSNMGRVKSLKFGKEKILKNNKVSSGYLQVNLSKDGKQKTYYIHRLVATAFITNPNNLSEVNHKNEDKTDNRVENLEWCNSKYNLNYGTRTERITIANSIPILQFMKDGEFIKKWDSTAQVERELCFNKGNISKCCKGKLKSAYGFKWRYHQKSLWEKRHIPLIKQKKVA